MIGNGRLLCGVGAVLMLSHVAAAQTGRDYSGSCTASGCHDAFSKKPVVHSPVSDAECDSCHEATDEEKHKFSLVVDAAELCLECHDAFEGKVAHDPVTNGECTTCHDPHSSEAPKLLLQAPSGKLCQECHEDVTKDLEFLHGPVGAADCTACHNPHAAEQAKLLARATQDLCLGCHKSLRDRFTARKHKHAPVEDDCLSCHNAHGADNRMNLTAKLPELCIDCHDHVGELMAEAPVRHDALTQGQSCAACHEPHASGFAHLLVRESMDLCLSCHDKEVQSGDVQLANISKLLEENPQHHGPIDDNDCTGCHVAHGGDHYRLLVAAYPAEFYASFAEERYQLCFECHEADLALEATTDSATGFRNGDVNLHYVHVNKAVKGRTCRACHETHAGRMPRLIRESVPFGDWSIPIRFQQTETGGGCLTGCHKPYQYDRERPVDNIPQSGPQG